MKICSKCDKQLPLEEFNSFKKSPDGKQGYCKICQREFQRAYYQKNKQRLNAARREWRKNNRDRDRDSYQRWKQNNPDEYRSSWKKHNRSRRRRVLEVVQGNSDLFCCRCGCDVFDLLEINHINGGGAKEVSFRNQQFYSRILNGERKTDDLEILCKMCNILHYLEMKHGSLPYILKWASDEQSSDMV